VGDLQEQSSASGPAPANESGTGARQLYTHREFSIRHISASDLEVVAHSHSAFTVTTVLSGEMTTVVGSGEEFTALAGQTVLTGAGETHAAKSERVELLSVGILPGFANELLAQIGFKPGTTEIAFAQTLVTDELVSSISRSIRNELSARNAGWTLVLEGLVRQLLIHLLRGHLTARRSPRIELSRAGPVDRRLRRAIEFIHDNYERELSLEEIASSAYLSEYHFARLFKQITGTTPGAYLANIRLERARDLLVTTQLPIGEIASRVGYQSQSHFTKVFKSVTGATPRSYRDAALIEDGQP
jgi:AraC family transcriptional regulator